MPLLDRIKDGFSNMLPAKHSGPPTSMSGGIGHGMIPFEDNMIVSKPTIVFHTSQVFFNFLAMACFASLAAFQAKWGVGPSGLSGFALFISIAGIFLSLFMLLVPVVYEKYDKLNGLARALKEVRVAFILTGCGVGASLVIAFVVTISAWTEAGCKNASKDPNASKGDDFTKGLDGWCMTKKAAAIFFWLAFVFWGASLGMLIMDWRSGKLNAPRDPPFNHPTTADQMELDEEDDEESSYTHIPPARRPTNDNSPNSPFADTNRYTTNYNNTSTVYSPGVLPVSAAAGGAAPRASMDAYGAFSDPAPSGFAAPSPASGGYTATSSAAPVLPEPDVGPRVSRTMQYADPYAAVRAQIAGGGAAGAVSTPPSYETYQGYR